MKEIWKDIKGYEGLYEISNLGRIRSNMWFNGKTQKYYKREKILKPFKTRYGYCMARLTKDKIPKSFSIHRLVAEAFIPNPNKLPQVNHKDENKTNNIVKNLEWCDGEYNARYSKAKSVLQCDLDNNVIKEWDCINEAHKKTNISQANIVYCCQNKRKTAGGYKWKYKKV